MKIGEKVDGAVPRPIKVILRGTEQAVSVLRSGSKLKQSPETKGVYFAPDRSPEERLARKKLVSELREKMKSQPGMYHYI